MTASEAFKTAQRHCTQAQQADLRQLESALLLLGPVPTETYATIMHLAVTLAVTTPKRD